ncbi:efflux RND transporter permease subunit [Thalassomonas sp. M1454]|uniref:efflux RND transporter permease subunit n=1 Tax=Thalassomonas sp. M1454 TaxID=2594477 RepID=UPI00117C5B3A|nr:efflux RND transporter permease subunit [Thalassomonas sp. M1454]TRX56559.1 efflux RND transporter permease subunit [Thalassomonas sp. M1454]
MNIVNVAVKRPVTIWMFTFAVLLFGMVSLSRLAVNLLPDLSYPTLTIRTDYIGAAPGEVEQLVTKPIEEAIGIVKGVRNVQSISKAGQSDVLLEFEWGTEMDMASLEVREKLDVIRLPLDVKKPLLLKFNPNLDPIIRFALKTKRGSETLDQTKLKNIREYAEEELKRKLESVSGVASVKIGGGLEKEIQILIDQHKISQLGIDSQLIIDRLQQENINQSGGKVEDGQQEFLVRTLNQFKNLDDIRNVYITSEGSNHIRLSDIAQVIDAHKERTSITRINGTEAVEVALYKEGDANTVNVAKKVDVRVEQLTQEFPDDLELIKTYDQSTFIANAINEVKSAAIVGGLLAMLVLFFFLKNIWATLIISISIPVSVIATFNLMYGNDISLNIMSLGGIALAVGLLVDNSIVVLENIARHKEQLSNADNRSNESDNNKLAATIGTKEVSTAIMASTLTTMAVFFPLVFVQGIAGQLFRDQALTVTFALLASLIVALTLIPMLSSRNFKSEETIDEKSTKRELKPDASLFKKLGFYLASPFIWLFRGVFYYLPLLLTMLITLAFRVLKLALGKLFAPLLWLFDKFYGAFAKFYQTLLTQALAKPALVLISIIAISASALPLFKQLNMEVIPQLSQGEFFVEVSHQPGTPLEKTDETLIKLSNVADKLPQVERTYALAGTGSLMNASPAQGGDYWGRLNVVLKNNASKADEQAVMVSLRDYLQNIAGVQMKFSTPELFSFKPPIEVELSGYDLDLLKRYSDKINDTLTKHKRFIDVKTSLQNGHPEIKIFFDHQRLAQLGLSAPQVSKLLATKVGGTIASQYSIKDKKIDILVRADESSRDSVTDIKQIIVNPKSDKPIPLSAVADVRLSVGPSEITRIDQQRAAIVSANFAYGDINDAVAELKTIISDMQIPLNISADITGQNEEMDVSFTSLIFALLLAVFLVYLVMASQFESLLHPLLILFTVPLAASGSIYGLYLTNTPLSVIVFIGLIMLAGIVVNNAIVLVDRINQLRESGMEKTQAIMSSATSRLRPIIMTTLTTTLGLLPLAISMGEGSEIRSPMAITVIFGLLFATLLTLFFIPVLYSLFDRKRFGGAHD